MKNVREELNELRCYVPKFAISSFDRVVQDQRFLEWPGSSDKHHNWDGGLAQHTLEVAQIALGMSQTIDLNRGILVVAAIWHDYGKLWSYQRKDFSNAPVGYYELEGSKFKPIEYKQTEIGQTSKPPGQDCWTNSELKSKMGGHLARSYAEYLSFCRIDIDTSMHQPSDFTEQVLHCILAHHGQRAWGSPAAPQSKEAWVLHLADSASARCLGGEDISIPHK